MESSDQTSSPVKRCILNTVTATGRSVEGSAFLPIDKGGGSSGKDVSPASPACSSAFQKAVFANSTRCSTDNTSKNADSTSHFGGVGFEPGRKRQPGFDKQTPTGGRAASLNASSSTHRDGRGLSLNQTGFCLFGRVVYTPVEGSRCRTSSNSYRHSRLEHI